MAWPDGVVDAVNHAPAVILRSASQDAVGVDLLERHPSLELGPAPITTEHACEHLSAMPAVEEHDRTTQCIGSLSPKARHVRHVEQDEHRSAQNEAVHDLEREAEDLLLLQRALALRCATVVLRIAPIPGEKDTVSSCMRNLLGNGPLGGGTRRSMRKRGLCDVPATRTRTGGWRAACA